MFYFFVLLIVNVNTNSLPVHLGKEARKKELKKNKKQRMAVRTAVLKGKDPQQLLFEMEKIDQMGKYIFSLLVKISRQ